MYRNIKAAVMGSINADMILNMDIVPEVGENVLGKPTATLTEARVQTRRWVLQGSVHRLK